MSKSSATISDPDAHIARKRFGQNFLQDPAIIARIVAAIRPQTGDRLVEIGPGQAAITASLIAGCGHVHAIEIDRDLAARLRERFDAASLTVDERDVLKVDFALLSRDLGGRLRIVGNLPYNISSPILFHLLGYAEFIIDQHVMLQKEVVDRMVADHGSKTYGRLSVMLQARYDMTRCLKVPPGAFTPAPKVDSAVVRMVPIAQPQVQNWFVFSALVAAAFSTRRKMLRNTLAAYGEAIDWDLVGIAPTQRAEEVSVVQFIGLANLLTNSLPANTASANLTSN